MSHIWMILLMTCCKLVRPQLADTQETELLFTRYPFVPEAPETPEPTDFLYIYPYKKDNSDTGKTKVHLREIQYDTNQIYENNDTKYKRKLQPYSVYRKFKDFIESNKENYEILRQGNEIKMQMKNFSNDVYRPTSLKAQPHHKESYANNIMGPIRKMNTEKTDLEVKLKRNFSPWGGKRNENAKHLVMPAHNEWTGYKRAKIVPQNLKFNAWGGKRSSNPIFKTEKYHKNKYIYTVNASKRIPFDAFRERSFDEARNRKLNKFHKCVGKRSNQLNENNANNAKHELLPATNYRTGTGPRVRLSAPVYDTSVYFPQGHWKKDGRRVETFSPWGGKRDVQEFELAQQAWSNADLIPASDLEPEDDNTINDYV